MRISGALETLSLLLNSQAATVTVHSGTYVPQRHEF